MILADTSVWVNHLRSGDERLMKLLEGGEVLAHPFVVGEVGLGSLRNRAGIIAELNALPRCKTASDDEVMVLVERRRLFGLGIGWIDAHLIAATQLTPGAKLLTYDKRLAAVSQSLDLAA
jgi:predicted nucleic acid-binding protein